MGNGVVFELSEQSIAAIEEIVETILGKDKATLTIRDRENGQILYAYRGDHLMRTASNMKIISGAAALAVLGKDYQFKTSGYNCQ